MISRVREFLFTPYVLMILGTNFASVLNFLTNVLLTRNLTPEDTAKYFTIAAIPPLVFSIFSFVPFKVASVTMTNLYAGNLNQKHTSKYFYLNLLTTSIWTLILVLFAFPLTKIFDLGDKNFLSTLFIILFFMAQINFITGLFQGLENYFFVAMKDISIALIKVTSLIIIIYWIGLRNAWAPLLAEATAVLFTLVWLYFFGKDYINSFFNLKEMAFSLRDIVEYFSSSASIIGGVMLIGLITSFDILLAKFFLQAKDAGYLIAASNLSKIVFFTCGSIPTLAYLFSTKYRIKKDANQTIKSLRFSFSLMFIIGLIVALLIGFNREFLILKMYGSTYQSIYLLLNYLLGYMLTISLCILLINFLMGQRWTGPLWFMSFLYFAFFIFSLTLGQISSIQLAFNLLIFSVLILVTLLLFTLIYLKRKQPPDSPQYVTSN